MATAWIERVADDRSRRTPDDDRRRELPAAGLADRPRAARGAGCPRACARASSGACSEADLEEAQDDATRLAVSDMERAGVDVLTDGEMRRESYSNRFATALDGVDLDEPGVALDRTGHENPVPRVSGPIRRTRPVEVRDVEFLRSITDRRIKITMPGPFTMTQQAQNDYYDDERSLALAYADAVNEELRDLKAAGADIVQIDEPYLQARPEPGARVRGRGDRPRARGDRGPDRPPHVLRLRAHRSRPAARLPVPAELDECRATHLSLEAAQPNLDCGRPARGSGQDRSSRRPRPRLGAGRDARGRRGARIRTALEVLPAERLVARARLRDEVPAARARVRASSKRWSPVHASFGRSSASDSRASSGRPPRQKSGEKAEQLRLSARIAGSERIGERAVRCARADKERTRRVESVAACEGERESGERRAAPADRRAARMRTDRSLDRAGHDVADSGDCCVENGARGARLPVEDEMGSCGIGVREALLPTGGTEDRCGDEDATGQPLVRGDPRERHVLDARRSPHRPQEVRARGTLASAGSESVVLVRTALPERAPRDRVADRTDRAGARRG